MSVLLKVVRRFVFGFWQERKGKKENGKMGKGEKRCKEDSIDRGAQCFFFFGKGEGGCGLRHARPEFIREAMVATFGQSASARFRLDIAPKGGALTRLVGPRASIVARPFQHVEVYESECLSACTLVLRAPVGPGPLEHVEVALERCRSARGLVPWTSVCSEPFEHVCVCVCPCLAASAHVRSSHG